MRCTGTYDAGHLAELCAITGCWASLPAQLDANLGRRRGNKRTGGRQRRDQRRQCVGVRPRATPEPQTHEFTLTASEFAWELMADVPVRVWGYNGQMPGPELRVTEGDTVRVTLVNQLPVPTTIHWHGINVPNAMDGVAGLNQDPVKPGATFTYAFTATPAGTRWYHSHTDPAVQVPLGLYGALIVEPRQPAATYEREYTLLLAEWDTELTPAVAAGSAPIGPRDALLRGGELGADLFLVNGKMHGAIPPLLVTEGERILLRLIHTGAIPHPIHTHGHSFQIVATDGNPVPEGRAAHQGHRADRSGRALRPRFGGR